VCEGKDEWLIIISCRSHPLPIHYLIRQEEIPINGGKDEWRSHLALTFTDRVYNLRSTLRSTSILEVIADKELFAKPLVKDKKEGSIGLAHQMTLPTGQQVMN